MEECDRIPMTCARQGRNGRPAPRCHFYRCLRVARINASM